MTFIANDLTNMYIIITEKFYPEKRNLNGRTRKTKLHCSKMDLANRFAPLNAFSTSKLLLLAVLQQWSPAILSQKKKKEKEKKIRIISLIQSLLYKEVVQQKLPLFFKQVSFD